MNEELKKALESLIEETITEIEDLKKSRFSASEIKIEGPGAGIDGKPSNGSLGKDEDKDEKDEKDAEKADKEDDKDEDDVKKAANREADPDGGKHKAPVPGMEHGQGPHDAPSEGAKARSGKNSEADPNGGHHKMDKAEDKKEDKKEPHKDDPKHEEKEKAAIKKLSEMHKGDHGKDCDCADCMKKGDGAKMGMPMIHKSAEETESLMKSYVEARVAPLESKLSSILDLVHKIADQPVAPKGVTSKMQPLAKGGDFVEPLSKSEAAKKLFELKKSGTPVDTLDIAKAEQGVDLQAIVKKYSLA